jgi:hypothetical protein
MRSAVVATAALALAAALLPEMRRWRAERELRRLTTAFHVLVARPGAVPEATRALAAVAAGAAALEPALAADPRAPVLAGSAHLVARRPAAALAAYRRALGHGERAEIDLNVARARAMLGDSAGAEAALLRAVWVNPVLLDALPRRDRARLRRRLRAATSALRAGRLAAPPPLEREGP